MSLPVSPTYLTQSDAEALHDLYRRGTPDNTLRAWERDFAYISAWKREAFGGRSIGRKPRPSRCAFSWTILWI